MSRVVNPTDTNLIHIRYYSRFLAHRESFNALSEAGYLSYLKDIIVDMAEAAKQLRRHTKGVGADYDDSYEKEAQRKLKEILKSQKKGERPDIPFINAALKHAKDARSINDNCRVHDTLSQLYGCLAKAMSMIGDDKAALDNYFLAIDHGIMHINMKAASSEDKYLNIRIAVKYAEIAKICKYLGADYESVRLSALYMSLAYAYINLDENGSSGLVVSAYVHLEIKKFYSGKPNKAVEMDFHNERSLQLIKEILADPHDNQGKYYMNATMMLEDLMND